MNIWEILSKLANADILGGGGWNIFSLSCFSLMFIYSLRKSLKYNWPIKSRRLMIICNTIFPLLFFYGMVDSVSGILYILTRTDPIKAALQYPDGVIYRLNPLLFPYSLSTIPLYGLMTYFLYRKHFSFKALLCMIVIQIAFIGYTLFVFDTANMRQLTGDTRTWFYITSFVPMWLMWLVGYTRTVK